jgi:hypothetical protein
MYRPVKMKVAEKGRNSSTIKTNCQFRITGRKLSNEQWKLYLNNLVHNHERPQSLAGLANARRDSNTQHDDIIRLCDANVRPRQILLTLQDSNLLNKRDIYNIKAAIKQKKLGSMSALEYVLSNLIEMNAYHRYFLSTSGELSSLFFAFEKAIELGKRFKTTFIIDATYRTNRFGLPLLHFIGIDCFSGSFSACFMLMSSENEAEYKRAIECFRECFGIYPEVFVTDKEDALRNALHEEFPLAATLLCIWHINKNILKNVLNQFKCRDSFDVFMKDWNAVLNSNTADDFEESLQTLREHYVSNKGALEYLDNNVIPLKKYISKPWTSLLKHLGNTATSRAEGQHRMVKDYFDSSVGDILTVAKNLHLSASNQYREFQIKVAAEKIRKHVRFDSFYDNVQGKISSFALDLVHEQVSLPYPLKKCTGFFKCVYGIPCAHILEQKLRNSILLEKEDFIQQWWLDDTLDSDAGDSFENEIQRVQTLAQAGGNAANSLSAQLRSIGNPTGILNPATSRSKGRPRGAKNKNRRVPSSFEHVEGNSSGRRCKNCNGVGHNSRTCTRNQLMSFP